MQTLESMMLRGTVVPAPTNVATGTAATRGTGRVNLAAGSVPRAVPAASSTRSPVRRATDGNAVRVNLLDGFIEQRAGGGITCHGEMVSAAHRKLRRAGIRGDFEKVVTELRRMNPADVPADTREHRAAPDLRWQR